jgi:hypothetical protein
MESTYETEAEEASPMERGGKEKEEEKEEKKTPSAKHEQRGEECMCTCFPSMFMIHPVSLRVYLQVAKSHFVCSLRPSSF